MNTRRLFIGSLVAGLFLFVPPVFAEGESCGCHAKQRCTCGETCECTGCHCDGNCNCKAACDRKKSDDESCHCSKEGDDCGCAANDCACGAKK